MQEAQFELQKVVLATSLFDIPRNDKCKMLNELKETFLPEISIVKYAFALKVF